MGGTVTCSDGSRVESKNIPLHEQPSKVYYDAVLSESLLSARVICGSKAIQRVQSECFESDTLFCRLM